MAFYYDKLRELRKARGLSQAELAQRLGLGKSTIAMYECGKRTPEFETIESICDFFNVNMAVLSDSKLAWKITDLFTGSSDLNIDDLDNNRPVYGADTIDKQNQPTFCDFLFGDEPETLAKIKSITFNGTFNMEGKLYEMPESTKQLLKQMIRTALEHMEETGQTSIEIVDKNK